MTNRLQEINRRAVVLFFGLASRVKADVSDTTYGLKNGRFWSTLNDGMKLCFIIGFSDAAAVSDCLGDRKLSESLSRPQLRFGEILQELNLFYSEGVNGPIAITDAMRYIRRKELGGTTEQLQNLVVRMRQVSSATESQR